MLTSCAIKNTINWFSEIWFLGVFVAKFCIFGALFPAWRPAGLVRFYYINSYTKLSVLMFDFKIAGTFGHAKEMKWGEG